MDLFSHTEPVLSRKLFEGATVKLLEPTTQDQGTFPGFLCIRTRYWEHSIEGKHKIFKKKIKWFDECMDKSTLRRELKERDNDLGCTCF